MLRRGFYKVVACGFLWTGVLIQPLAAATSSGRDTLYNTVDASALIDPQNYGYAYWLNGFRKNPDDQSPDQLVFETGYYGFKLDLGDLQSARFGRSTIGADYKAALSSEAGLDPKQLDEATLSIQLASSGRTFTATRATTGPSTEARRLQDNRLWESGRYVQHFDLQHLVFADQSGNELSCEGRLEVVSWPDSLTLSAEITPKLPFIDGPTIGVSGNGINVVESVQQLSDASAADSESFTLEAWVYVPRNPSKPNRGWLLSKNGMAKNDGHIGFSIRGNRIDASINIGGSHKNRHVLREQNHKLFNFDQWNHLALSYDGQTMCFYVNGRLENSKAIGKARTPGNGPILLGSDLKKASQTVAYGTFDQIRYWNHALSADEIEAHTAKPDQVSTENGLIYEETFDGPGAPQPRLHLWQNVVTRIQLKTTEDTWEVRSDPIEKWEMGETRRLTLNCEIEPNANQRDADVQVTTADNQTIQAKYKPEFNSLVAEVKKIRRNWPKGYTDIRDYDEFVVNVETDKDSDEPVPFMLYLRDVANITGLVPILCELDGTPTGIPVQISKNWHDHSLGSYLRAYMLLPTETGSAQYKLRIPYGFYGTLPSASHAQLSLVGYGGNGRWDQLAIGCWGETICFDVDRSCVDVAVTDVRMLMARIGASGRKWHWTNAGWGGDWLHLLDANGKRHHPNGLKTAYLAHGPCLTDVKYEGNFGTQREASFNVRVQTLRTDDYARTFFKIRYTFNQEVPTEGAWLFKMGRTHHYMTPQLAYGNQDGPTFKQEVPTTQSKGTFLFEQTAIEGSAPWWVSFPGASQTRDDGKGNGYRALVIRDYTAKLGGQTYNEPTISAPVFQENKDGTKNLDLLLTAPAGVESFKLGDTIEMDLEWITLHREAGDYYGPNEAYRAHLEENPNSWKTTYREAIGNNLKVDVNGGNLINRYPIQIEATDPAEITVLIQGGVGYVPLRFDGLPSASGYTLYQVIDGQAKPLDQSVHGNDFWQADYDPATNSYSLVYNLPLDGWKSSSWILKKQQ